MSTTWADIVITCMLSVGLMLNMAVGLIEDYLANMFTVTQPTTIALICLYAPVFLFSLAGNSFVIVMFVKAQHTSCRHHIVPHDDVTPWLHLYNASISIRHKPESHDVSQSVLKDSENRNVRSCRGRVCLRSSCVISSYVKFIVPPLRR